MDIIIRSARAADLPVLKAFEQGIIKAERPYDHTLKPDPISYYDIGELIRSDAAEVAVAEIDGELVASGYAQKKRSLEYVFSEAHAFIGFLYVAPDYRGKGVNRRILSKPIGASMSGWAIVLPMTAVQAAKERTDSKIQGSYLRNVSRDFIDHSF